MAEPNKIRRSSIWLYFSKDKKRNVAQCIICGTMITTIGGSSSNLCRHLRAKHKKIKFPKKQLIVIESDDDNNYEEVITKTLQKSEQNLAVLEGVTGETVQAETILQDGMETEDMETAEPTNTTRKTTQRKSKEISTKKYRQLARQSTIINNKKMKQFFLRKKLEQAEPNKKVEALLLIAHSLGRMASSLEVVADCFRQYIVNNQSNIEVISKLNEVLEKLNVNTIQKEQTNDIVTEISKTFSPILRTLKLLPTFTIPKPVKKSSLT